VIEVRELSKRGAVDRLSFDVRPGVVTGFLGPNGAGKTTAMRLILGLDNPTRGAATVDGRAYRELPAGAGALVVAAWLAALLAAAYLWLVKRDA
jgi:ABC-2 type transport system ATP-binding protein